MRCCAREEYGTNEYGGLPLEYPGPTTRHSIRTFFIWAKKRRINKAVQIGHRQAKTTAALTTTGVVMSPYETRISLGAEPVPVPQPFAGMLMHHLHNDPTYAPAAA